ncbi:tripartite motif-containing protein 16-like protein [Engraulis encrasicolus]|uniref:tripartite motif-containing protein 16-like protein n=1 Tax=Engraulis encrasicolus TaxID=184585 RepID=UPI002FD072F9
MDDDREFYGTLGNKNILKLEEVEQSFNRADEDYTTQGNDSRQHGEECIGNPLARCANHVAFLDCSGGGSESSGLMRNATEDLQTGSSMLSINSSVEELHMDAADSADVVPCDSCIQSPQRAVKSCLTCLVSFCEAHLRPHLEKPRFHSHRLVAPQHDLEMRCCPQHRMPLDLFCCPDARCICPGCREEPGHRGHRCVPVREARRLAEAELQRRKGEMRKTISIAEDAITSLQNNTNSAEGAVVGLQAIVEQQFSRLHGCVERARGEVWGVLEGELERTVGQAEGIRAHLHLKICQLRRSLEMGDKFGSSSNDVDFMQEYQAWLRSLVNTDLPGVYIGLPDRLSTFKQALSSATQELCQHLLDTYRHQITELSQREGLGMHTAIQSTPSDHSDPEPVTHSDFLRYATSLTVNLDSVHQFLRITEGGRRITNTTPWQHCYPEHPERFQHWRQALANQSLFLGRHYFEVELMGDGAHVGLTYNSIKRKSPEISSCITGNTFSWSLGRSSHSLSCWHAGEERCLQGEPLSCVGVYVEYQSGLVAFYGVAAAAGSMTLLHKYNTQFLEPLYPAFWLSKKDNVVHLHNLDEKRPAETPSIPASGHENTVTCLIGQADSIVYTDYVTGTLAN